MRIRFHLSDQAKDILGEVMIMCVLGLALVASYSCGSETPPGDTAATAVSTPEYSYETVARTEPVSPVATAAAAVPSEEPTPVVVTYETAEAAYRDGRFLEAVELFEGYVDDKPENPWGHYMLGLSARMVGKTATAVAAFERALELDPEHVKSHLNLARVLIGDGRLDSAGEHVDRALELDPESSDAYRLLGRVSSELGDTERAVEAFEEALIRNEWDTWSMNNLGVLFIAGRRYDDALPPLARAVELRDDVAVFQNNLGMALERLGYFVEATEAYRTAVTLDPGYTRASSNFERIDERSNRRDVTPLDLAAVATGFADEIATWRTRLADVPVADSTTTENAADQTPPTISVPTPDEIKPDTVRVPTT